MKIPDYTNSELIALIDERIHSERDREIMTRRLIDGLTQDMLSEEFGLSTRQIQRIIYKAQNRLF